MKLCSACLLGVECRYDGKSKTDKKVLELAKKRKINSSLSRTIRRLANTQTTFRTKKGKVITKTNKDVTREFIKGAEEVLKIAKLFGINEAIFKQKSPSCGCDKIYDGSFTGNLIKGDGVTTSLLKKNGIKVVTEENLNH